MINITLLDKPYCQWTIKDSFVFTLVIIATAAICYGIVWVVDEVKKEEYREKHNRS